MMAYQNLTEYFWEFQWQIALWECCQQPYCIWMQEYLGIWELNIWLFTTYPHASDYWILSFRTTFLTCIIFWPSGDIHHNPRYINSYKAHKSNKMILLISLWDYTWRVATHSFSGDFEKIIHILSIFSICRDLLRSSFTSESRVSSTCLRKLPGGLWLVTLPCSFLLACQFRLCLLLCFAVGGIAAWTVKLLAVLSN